MKKLIGLLAAMLMPVAAWAGNNCDSFVLDTISVTNSATTNSGFAYATVVKTTMPVEGFVKSVEITAVSAQTCSVMVVVGTNFSANQVVQQIYSNATLTGSVPLVYPRRQVNDIYGNALGVTTNEYEAIYLSQDDTWMYVWNSTATNNCRVRAKVNLWR